MRARLALCALLMAGPALAQEDDRDYLTAFLEDSLSGMGREVTVTGFTGALSSQATIETLSIADAQGVWLTIDGITLDWSRSSLLSGVIDISELSAQRIELSRLPQSDESSLPAPEATPFALPELPVSIQIGRLAADRIELGESVLGQAVTGQLEASLGLEGGVGQAKLDLLRLGDGPQGEIKLDAGYDNASGGLSINLDASETAQGLVATLLDIPGAPAASLTVAGTGTLDAFAADIALATDGETRLGGKVTLDGVADGGRRMQADLAGNIAPLLAPDYVDFFGTKVALKIDATQAADGRLWVDQLGVKARVLDLTGRLELAADGLPDVIDLTGTLADPAGSPVLLPLPGQPTHVDRAAFSLTNDKDDKTRFEIALTVDGLDRPDLRINRLGLSGQGRINDTAEGRLLGMRLGLKADGLAPSDLALSAALGPWLEAGLRLRYLEGSDALRLSDMFLVGDDLDAKANLGIEGLGTGFLTTGMLDLETKDLARFSGLVGRPLAGQGTVRLQGEAGVLSGQIDGTAEVVATGLRVGIDPVDRLMTGAARATLSLRRDETGTRLRAFELTAGPLVATAAGMLASSGSEVTGKVALADLAALGPGYGGGLVLEGGFTGTPTEGRLTLTGTGTSLRVGTAEADRLLAGTSRLAVEASLDRGLVQLTKATLANPQLTLDASGKDTGTVRNIDLTAKLANLGLLVPDLVGPLTLSGTIADDGSQYGFDLRGQGPGQVDARVKGQLARDLSKADLAINGTGQGALVNLFIAPRSLEGPVRYDLRVSGPLAPGAVSGRVTLANGRLSDPSLGFALEGIEALADLDSGQAALSLTAGLSTGGRFRVDGPVGLSAPYAGKLTVALDAIRLRDPSLYDVKLDGSLTVDGPLTGGAVIAGKLGLSEAEVQVPSSGFDTAGALADLRHVNEPAEVRATRVRAGLVDSGKAAAAAAGGSTPFRLDLAISAPSRIFIRGRGIDAELGGALQLRGTTDDIIPSGGFNLIRGRLDILGKRLVLAKADLVMEGSFVPVLTVQADTTSDGVVSSVRVDGPADDPVVSFTSVPELPQEEVLARLLFGRSLDSISALQAAQLANAVAVLAGRGGEGMVNRLRRGFGLDDLDLATAEDGSTALKAGKYLSENLYTEVEIDQGGKTRVNLNLDLRPGVTVKAGIGNDGKTGIGVFLEKDY
jgi:translocation and assembly module TamB